MLTSLARLSFSFIAAISVSLALFLFMQQLVSQPVPTLPDMKMSGLVELFRPTPESEPEPEQKHIEPETQEPVMEDTVLEMAPAADTMADKADFIISPGEFNLPLLSGSKDLNVATAGELLREFGEDTRQGFVEITPFTTRRPNIPDIAFENQLNGWVLVIFNVTPDGKTRNIKVLDAQPKGIFEQEVIRAISYWRYDVSGLIKDGQDVVLTQKIELHWQHYTENIQYPDNRHNSETQP